MFDPVADLGLSEGFVHDVVIDAEPPSDVLVLRILRKHLQHIDVHFTGLTVGEESQMEHLTVKCYTILFAFLIAIPLSGCANYGAYTGSTSYGGGDENGVTVYKTIYPGLPRWITKLMTEFFLYLSFKFPAIRSIS